MNTPHKCPICDGTGLVSRPPGVAGDQMTWDDNGTSPYDCGPCKGTGVLWEKKRMTKHCSDCDAEEEE